MKQDERGRDVVSFIELASGLNRWSDASKSYVPASAEIEIVDGYGVFRKAQHSIIFAGHLNHPEGTIDMLLPDAKRLKSRVLGIAFADAEDNNSVFLAETVDVDGELTGNQIIYPDAFDSGVTADVQYTATISSFEQDLVIRRKFPVSPADMGLDGETCRIQIWSEFLQTPQPFKRARVIRRTPTVVEQDESLDFGSFEFTAGKAFLLGAGDNQNAANETTGIAPNQKGMGRYSGKNVLNRIHPLFKAATVFSLAAGTAGGEKGEQRRLAQRISQTLASTAKHTD